jgi:hypothetical protein
VPTFLLPLLGPVAEAVISDDAAGTGMTDAKRLLLSVLGDLEAVLGDAVLRKALLTLSPQTLLLLLSYDDLKVCVAGRPTAVMLGLHHFIMGACIHYCVSTDPHRVCACD